MRSAIILVMALVPFQSFAGVGGGGVGPRPTMMFRQNVDLVRTLAIDKGKVTFLYKAFDQSLVSRQTVDFPEINDVYFAALKESLDNSDWQAIPVAD